MSEESFGYIRVHPVAGASALAWKADTAVIEFDDKGRAKSIVLKAGQTKTKTQPQPLPAAEVRYLTGTDEHPSFKVQAVSSGQVGGIDEATAVVLAHNIPVQNEPGRRWHLVSVYAGERTIWVRKCEE